MYPQDPLKMSSIDSCIEAIKTLKSAAEEHIDMCNCQLDILETERINLKDLQSKPKANVQML